MKGLDEYMSIIEKAGGFMPSEKSVFEKSYEYSLSQVGELPLASIAPRIAPVCRTGGGGEILLEFLAENR